MVKKIAVVQSSYVPWKGYFDLMNQVDEFVLYDDVQYTRRDWRNRNRIKAPRGPLWLTIPTQVKGRYLQKIKDTVVNDPGWPRRHWETVRQCYGRAPYFPFYKDLLEETYLACGMRYLSEINFRWLQAVRTALGITGMLSWSMDYRLEAEDPTGRLIEVCRKAGAGHYVSGPSARAYLDEGAFRRAGIGLSYVCYDGYPPYPQVHGPFEHHVSILDLLLMTGPQARHYMLTFRESGGGRLAG